MSKVCIIFHVNPQCHYMMCVVHATRISGPFSETTNSHQHITHIISLTVQLEENLCLFLSNTMHQLTTETISNTAFNYSG